jgi:hypothetical protein
VSGRLRLRAILAASVLWLLASADPASAQPKPLDAQLIWVRGDDVYLAASDSIAVGIGTLLTLVSRGKVLGTAKVARVFDRELAVARLTSGSLRDVNDMRRVRVLAERAESPRLLRVGYPSRARSNLLFSCGRMPFNRTWQLSDHRLEETTKVHRLTMPGPFGQRLLGEGQIPWPDTLEIRLFDDAADQEIALERGELDVAVFWPGELSTHMRERPRWKDRLAGTMARGLIGAIRLGPEAGDGQSAMASREADAFAALNRELFRGDLQERTTSTPGSERREPPSLTGPAARVRYEVDVSCPGKPVLEAFLNRDHPARQATEDETIIRLFRLDRPCSGPEDVLRGLADHFRSGPYPTELRTRADSLVTALPEGPGRYAPSAPDRGIEERLGMLRVSFPLAIACPVVCDPALLPYVSALGADAFVNLLDCRRGER